MKKITAIFFDMDGVLIDAKEWHYEALNKALELFGYDITHDEHIKYFDGLPTKDKLNLISANSNLPIALHTFINELKQKYTHELIEVRCRPIFQHEYALSRLKSKGYVLALCSNSSKNTVFHMLDKAYLKDYFDLILTNEDVRKSKPDPEIYQLAMERLKCTPEECLVLEDNKNGIKAAIASGANLLRIDTIYDVNFKNIINYIECLEGTI